MDSDAPNPPDELPAPRLGTGSAEASAIGPASRATDGTGAVALHRDREPRGSEKPAGDTAPRAAEKAPEPSGGGTEDAFEAVETTVHSAAGGEALSQEDPDSEVPSGKLSLGSLAIHADDCISAHAAIAPALHVSTTFRYNKSPANLVPLENLNVITALLPVFLGGEIGGQ